jgi:hypothetical protein
MKPLPTKSSVAPKIAGLVTILLSMAAVTASAATIADIAGDYTGPSALPAGWSYFASNQASGGTEIALTPNLALGVATGGTNIGFGTSGGVLNLPGVLGTKIPAAEFEIFPDGDSNAPVLGTDLVLHPGSDGATSTVILRYTISLAQINAFGTTGSIAGSFRDLVNPVGGNSVTVSVYQNSTQLFTKSGTVGMLTQADGTFNITGLTMAANDTISFALNSNNEWGADESALRGTIALIPEPSAYALFAGSLCFMLAGRRSRKA